MHRGKKIKADAHINGEVSKDFIPLFMSCYFEMILTTDW